MSHKIITHRHGIWYLSNVIYERLKLFTFMEVLGFAVGIAFVLVLIFPHQNLEDRLAESEKQAGSDLLTVEYLKVSLRVDPENYNLRLLLARRLMQRGSYNEAREVLKPLKSIQRLNELLSSEFTAAQLVQLGRRAFAAGDHQLANDAFSRVFVLPATLSDDEYVSAAVEMLGVGEYRTSSEFYFLAMKSSESFTKKREYYMRGLGILQSASLFDDVISSADRYLQPFSQDVKTLEFLMRLARAANRPAAAARYAKLFMKLSEHTGAQRFVQRDGAMYAAVGFNPQYLTHAAFHGGVSGGLIRVAANEGHHVGATAAPFNDEAYSQAYEVFVGAKNLVDARKLAISAVAQRPNSAIWRKRLAQVTEWSNLPKEALPAWLEYLRLNGSDEQAWDRVVDLSRALYDLDSLRQGLEYKAQSEPDHPKWTTELLALYETRGETELAIALLNSRIARLPASDARKREYEQSLVGAYERKGEIDLALQVALKMQARAGRTVASATKIANLYFKQNKITEAFTELHLVRDLASKSDQAYWRSYAEVSSLVQNDEAAQEAYKVLLANDVFTEADINNLLAVWTLPRPRAAAKLAQFAYFRGKMAVDLPLKTTLLHSETGTVLELEDNFQTHVESYQPHFAELALQLYVRLADWPAARQFLNSLTAEQLAVLEQDVSFLTSRAALEQATHNMAAAQRDVRSALAIDPSNADLRADLIWELIAGRDTESLKEVLKQWAGDAENNPALWGPYSAALMSINRQHDALHYFRKSGFPRNDYLWQMSYAECLDANSQTDLAWQIRRRAWLNLRKPEVLKKLPPDVFNGLRERLTTLAPLFDTGEGAQRIIQSLLRSDVAALQAPLQLSDVPRTGKALVEHLATVQEPHIGQEANGAGRVSSAQQLFKPSVTGVRPQDDPRLSATVKELALAYALDSEEYDLARVWLVTRFANQLAKPLWGELSLLLVSDDRSSLMRVLDEAPDWLPMYDRVEAAQRVGSSVQAQTWAFDQLAHLSTDEQLHAQLTGLAMIDHSSMRWDFTSLQQEAALNSSENHVSAAMLVSPRVSVAPSVKRRIQGSVDPIALPFVPAVDDTLSLTVRKQTDAGYISAAVQRRQAALTTQGFAINYAEALTRELEVMATLGVNQEATESTLLRLGGMRSGLTGSVIYALSHREYARLNVENQRYASQQGTSLGSGTHWAIEVGSHLRLEYPDVVVRGLISDGTYTSSGVSDAQIARFVPVGTNPVNFVFVPVSSMMTGLSLGIGTTVEQGYVRSWRPYGEFGLNHDSVSGSGYDISGGLAGSVFGGDVLRLHMQIISSSQLVRQGSRELGMRYQWFY